MTKSIVHLCADSTHLSLWTECLQDINECEKKKKQFSQRRVFSAEVFRHSIRGKYTFFFFFGYTFFFFFWWTSRIWDKWSNGFSNAQRFMLTSMPGWRRSRRGRESTTCSYTWSGRVVAAAVCCWHSAWGGSGRRSAWWWWSAPGWNPGWAVESPPGARAGLWCTCMLSVR